MSWWIGVAAFNVLTALVHGVTTATDAARWWASPDALVPERTARWFLDGGSGMIFPGWQATDRGPLQPLLLLWGGRWSTNPVPAYFTGVVVNSVWVVGLWWFLRAVGVDDRRIRWTVTLTALTGSIWLNTVYPWPKLLAGALALGCAAAVLEKRPVLAGVLGGLALLAHGAALFALIGLVPWVVTRLGRRGLLALLVCVAVYAPWTVFVRAVDPPGDRLVKWHFAGTDIDTPDNRSAVEAILSEYRHAGIGIVENKVDNLRTIFGDPTIWDLPWQGGTPKWTDDGIVGKIRAAQLSRIVFAPGVLLLGLFFGWRRVPRTVWLMLGGVARGVRPRRVGRQLLVRGVVADRADVSRHRLGDGVRARVAAVDVAGAGVGVRRALVAGSVRDLIRKILRPATTSSPARRVDDRCLPYRRIVSGTPRGPDAAPGARPLGDPLQDAPWW